MDLYTERQADIPKSLHKLFVALATVSILLLTPFTINNMIQGRIFLGIAGTVILVIFAINAWSIAKRRTYYPGSILYGLVPLILIFLVFALYYQGIIGVFWCYPAVIAFYFLLQSRWAWIANALLLVIAVPFSWVMLEQTIAIRVIVTLSMVSIFSAIFMNVIAAQQYELRKKAVTDPLTGVLNRALLQTNLEQAIAQHQRSAIPMTIMTLDLDYFKKINDTFGHDVGDQVLKQFAGLIKSRCRSVDKVFRLGGEEFLVYLYNTDLKNALLVAEDMRSQFESLNIIPQHTPTVSIGVAQLQSNESWLTWMKRSDTNLYFAKSSGRNRVVA
ncbi:GGDEF domain-containing protein [Flocculibacter collagenilyticus]|uniref:GGDEF domain-containing protein n=1 Tax=Flocculibacter collagenilyticus TaxID=2744479 RepID=UPI0018F68FE3|nr:GGDEF domain-containing protein [Flocculibacter collagenilyticus]